MKKKLLTILLSVFMIVTTFTTKVFADGNVAKIGAIEYATLADAIAAAPNDEETTISILNDISYETFNAEDGISAAVVIPSTKKIVLDLNGKTISGLSEDSKAAYLFHNKGHLTIKDSQEGGKITYKSNGPDGTYGYGTSTILNRGVLTIESGTVENTTTGGASYAVDNQTLWFDDIIPVEFNMNGGNVVCTTGDASIRQGAGCGTVYTKGGEIVKNYVTISGGTVTGDIWIQNLNVSYTDLKIEGGTITGKVYPTCADYTNMTVSISGGKINKLGRTDTPFMNGIVTGGLYANEPLDGFIAEGHECVSNTDETTKGDYPWKIGKIEVAKIGDITYPSLAKAVEDVPTDGTETTITMIDNETFADNANMIISAGQNIVLDLNGKIVTGKNLNVSTWAFLTNNGTLTITDTSNEKNGKITSSTTPETDRFAGHYTVLNKNKLTLENGIIEETSEKVGNGVNLKWALRNEASANQKVSLTINDGSVIGEYNALSNYVYDNTSKCICNINGGSIITYGRFSPMTMQIANASKPNFEINITDGEFIVKNVKNTNANGNAIIYCDDQAKKVNDISTMKFNISGGKFNTYNTAMIVQFDDFKDGQETPKKYMSSGIMKIAINDNEIVPGYTCVANDDESTKELYPWKIGKLTSGKIEITETENDVPNFYNEVEELQDAIDNVTEANQEKFEENKEIKLSTITVDNTGGINAQIDDTVKIIANENTDNDVKADPGYRLNVPTTEGGKTTYTAQSLDIGKDYQGITDGTGKKDSKQTATELKQTAEGTTQAVKDSAKSVKDTEANKQLEKIVHDNLNTILFYRSIHQGTAAKALNKEGIAITNEGSTGSIAAKNVNVFVLTYYDTKVLEDKTTQSNKSYTLDITPMYQAYASTAASKETMKTEGTGKDSVKIGDSLPVDCTGKTINLKIELPNGFITNTNQKVYVVHILANGTKKTYDTIVTEDAGKFFIEFTNPDGFSEFEITLKNPNPTPSPSLDSKPKYKAPKTGIEGTTNNCSLLKLSSLSLFAIGTYIAIKKKKDN